jgi:hypothetical protein
MPVCGTVHSNHVEPPANSQRFYAAPALRCVCLRHRFKPDNTFYISVLSRCSRILWRHKVIVSFKTVAAVLNSNTRTKICNWTRWQKQFSKNKSKYVTLEVLKAMNTKISVCLCATPCSLAHIYPSFGETCFLYVQRRRASFTRNGIYTCKNSNKNCEIARRKEQRGPLACPQPRLGTFQVKIFPSRGQYFAMKTEAVGCFVALVSICQPTRRHISQENNSRVTMISMK